MCAYIGALSRRWGYAVIPRAKQWEAMAEPEQQLGLQEGVRPAGLNWPVVGPVSSPYGMRWGRTHEGIDIAAPVGTPILAAADGQVVLRQWFGGYKAASECGTGSVSTSGPQVADHRGALWRRSLRAGSLPRRPGVGGRR